MKNRIVVTGMVLLGIVFSSCHKERIRPSANITKESRAVAAFTGISVEDAIQVYVDLSSDENNLRVKANQNLHPYIKTEVKSGNLIIRMKRNLILKRNATIKVYVSADKLNRISASGASEIYLLNKLTTDNLSVDASGASRISCSIASTTCSVDASGASNVHISGTVGNAAIDLSGASTMNNHQLVADAASVDLSGASSAFLTVNSSLDVVASGASTFNYLGSPQVNKLNLSGASSVHKQ